MVDTNGPKGVPTEPAQIPLLKMTAQIPLLKMKGAELDTMRIDLSHRVIKVEGLEEAKKDNLAAMNHKLRKARKDMLAVARVLEEQQQAFG